MKRLSVLLAFAAMFGIGITSAFAAPPTVSSFTASPSRIVEGSPTTLAWQVSGATRVAISHGVGTVTGRTSITARPGATTRYFLTASNADGTTTKDLYVFVTEAPVITPPPVEPPPPVTPPCDCSEVFITWDPPTMNDDNTPLTDLAKYVLYFGTSINMQNKVELPAPRSSATIHALKPGMYYFALRAVNAKGAESALSNTVTKVVSE